MRRRRADRGEERRQRRPYGKELHRVGPIEVVRGPTLLCPSPVEEAHAPAATGRGGVAWPARDGWEGGHDP